MTNQGVQLFQPEANVLLEIELQINRNIPKVTQIGWNTFGFTATNNHVTGLGLYSQGLKSLPESLPKLTNLQKLWLNNNLLNTLPESLKAFFRELKTKVAQFLELSI